MVCSFRGDPEIKFHYIIVYGSFSFFYIMNINTRLYMSYLKEKLTEEQLNAMTKFLAPLATDNDIKILKKKGHENPTEEEKALLVAYGVFNALECSNNVGGSAQNFAFAVDDYIEQKGGWDKL